MSEKIGVIAFSGGLDTSFLVPYCREKYDLDKIITCAVDTGGFSDEEIQRIADRSVEVGADEHVYINAEQEFYDSIIKYMIYGNITRDGYPMSVGTERLIQAKKVLETCLDKGATAFIHGSTGAGNDQYRFDTVIHVLGQGKVEIITPVRQDNVMRETSMAYLRERQITVSEKARYSYNVGLWGVSIGGDETHNSTGLVPEEAWYSHPKDGLDEMILELSFDKGEVNKLKTNGETVTGAVNIIKKLAAIGNDLAIGRHYYTGTSIPGKKGRLAYESPAADIIYAAHNTLEQITLSSEQIFTKKSLGDKFGRFIHEAKMFDPIVDDLRAFLHSTQRRVTGTTSITLAPYHIKHITADSPNNLLGLKGAVYGETSSDYTGDDARSAAKLYGFEQKLWNAVED